MANPEHLAELKKGVKSWNAWRQNNEEPLDLCRANLSGADLHEVNLSEADLSQAHLVRTCLIGANLIGADLHEVNLSEADLTHADLTHADLTRADLSAATLTGAILHTANLSAANLSRANLTGANLTGVSLRGADLSATHLCDADLSQANLSGANLNAAVLVRANLSGTDLSSADFRGANLNGANLAGADLDYTYFSSADLRGANLSRAGCGYTNWAFINLLETTGLSELNHRTASTIGTNTLVLSKGRLPAKFLKGCGLADWEFESAKLYDPDLTTAEITEIQYRIYDLLASGPIQISPVFISYAHADSTFVDKLGGKLDEKGVRYWRDTKDATAGRLDKIIERGISLNPTLLLVLSGRSVESDWVEFEVDKAIQLTKQLKRDVLCPVALDKAWLTSDRMSGNLRAQIKKYNVLDFSSHADDKAFARQFRKLIDGLGFHYRCPAGIPIPP